MSRTRAVAVLVLLSALGLTGCSDDDPEPRFEPTSPTSEAPSSPTTTAAATFDSPEDVVRAWVAARNKAQKTGDIEELRSLTAKECRGCAPFIDSIEDVYENGGHLETAGWKVVGAKARAQAEPVRVDAAISMAGGMSFPSPGAEPIRFSGDKVIMTFEVIDGPEGMQVSLVALVG